MTDRIDPASAMMFYDFKQHGMIVMDGQRVIAKARNYGARVGHLLTMYNGSWVDSRSRKPNVLGIVDPARMLIRSRPEAERIMRGLANSGGQS